MRKLIIVLLTIVISGAVAFAYDDTADPMMMMNGMHHGTSESMKMMPKKMHGKMMTTATGEAAGQVIKCTVTGAPVNLSKDGTKMVYKGKTYYFCCPSCEIDFKKNTKKYTKKYVK